MSRINDAVSRILAAKFDLGLFEHPWTNRRHIDDIGSKAPPGGGPQGRAGVAGAAQETARHASAASGRDGVRRRKQCRQHRQPGRWLDTDLAGRVNQRDPGPHDPGGDRAAGRQGLQPYASAPVPSGAAGIVVVGETPYAEGFGDVGGPLWAYDPGDDDEPRGKTMQLSDADKAAVQKVCAKRLPARWWSSRVAPW